VDANSGQVVGLNAPAHPGDFIMLYCTGLGTVDTTTPNGSPPAGLTHTNITPVIYLGGVVLPSNSVQFSGLAPDFVGLYQINVQLPANARTGDEVPLLLSDGAGTYSNTVFVAIH
jgi:uncharacterized protein (TIGR03437 family)